MATSSEPPLRQPSPLHDGATYYYVSIQLDDDGTMDIPVIHYEGEDWVFTPWDWQSCFAGDASDVETVRWRAGEQEAIMMDGLPRLFAL